MTDLPEFLVRKVEQAIADATNPKGMGLHDGMARIEASLLARLLKAAQLAAPASGERQPVAGNVYRKCPTHGHMCQCAGPCVFPVANSR